MCSIKWMNKKMEFKLSDVVSEKFYTYGQDNMYMRTKNGLLVIHYDCDKCLYCNEPKVLD